MRRKITIAGLLIPVSLASILSAAADQSFSIEGNADALTLNAKNAVRSVVVEALAKRFDIKIVGNGLTEGPVDGQFSGDLSHVLKAVLPGDGYGIAYSDGRPVRITFSGGASTEPLPPAPPPIALAPNGTALIPTESKAVKTEKPDPQVTERFMQDAATQQLLALKPKDTPPPEPVAGGTMQQQIAAAQARALADLKVLTDNLKKAGQQ